MYRVGSRSLVMYHRWPRSSLLSPITLLRRHRRCECRLDRACLSLKKFTVSQIAFSASHTSGSHNHLDEVIRSVLARIQSTGITWDTATLSQILHDEEPKAGLRPKPFMTIFRYVLTGMKVWGQYSVFGITLITNPRPVLVSQRPCQCSEPSGLFGGCWQPFLRRKR